MHAQGVNKVNRALRDNFISIGNVVKQLIHAFSCSLESTRETRVAFEWLPLGQVAQRYNDSLVFPKSSIMRAKTSINCEFKSVRKGANAFEEEEENIEKKRKEKKT